MPPFRPSGHHPVPGSVRSQDAPRLQRLRRRLARRFERRHRRQLFLVAMAVGALAVALLLAVEQASASAAASGRESAMHALFALGGLTAFALGVYALWRFDQTRRRARSARIRLQHVEQRLVALARGVVESADGDRTERPVA